MSVVTSSSQAAVVPADQAATGLGLTDRVSDYLEMCRPRIAVMTLITVSAGFVLASPITIQWRVLAMALCGILQLVASSSILNQMLEAGTDLRMARTAARPIASGRVSRLEATLVGVLLSGTGAGLLWYVSNPATTFAGLATVVLYVLAYTPLKTRSSLCTTIGAIPGAMPPVLGWLAAGGSFSVELIALFALLFTWQFPHFLAIGWMYREQYQQAGLKMLPSFSDGGRRAGLVALIYAIAFVPVSLLPAYTGLTGRMYFATAVLLSGVYLVSTVRFTRQRTDRRARQLLLVSLFVLPLLLTVMVAEFLHLTAAG